MSDDIAAKIIVIGMRDGIFTGYKLSNYFEPEPADWVGARAIINGQDKAHQRLIFQAVLRGPESRLIPPKNQRPLPCVL